MNKNNYKGTSNTGDFKEALSDAIQTAKEELLTDYIEWELLKVNGKHGGFIQEDILDVNISASSIAKSED